MAYWINRFEVENKTLIQPLSQMGIIMCSIEATRIIDEYDVTRAYDA